MFSVTSKLFTVFKLSGSLANLCKLFVLPSKVWKLFLRLQPFAPGTPVIVYFQKVRVASDLCLRNIAKLLSFDIAL